MQKNASANKEGFKMVVAQLQKVDNDEATMHISLPKIFMPEQRFKVFQFLELGEMGCGLVGCG